ncbi:MAG TPA: c-type cytochrome, partial [Planctomycetota bacterium]|nr:c-type cytochrome [Planctomycetota bacterium]
VNRKARRPGPPLERIAAKVEPDWMKKWVLEPRDFRPTTRMPHFFQLSNTRHEVNKKPYPPEKGRSPVDDAIVTCITEYIWSLSKTEKDPEPPALKGDRRRGELLVQQVGCVACHKVDDIAVEEYRKRGESRFLKEFAPTLAGIGSKVNRAWLYAWVRDPKKHFQDSSMPNLRLTEQEAVDVVEYLMSLKKPEWEAKAAPKANMEVVKDLVREQLKKVISDRDAELAVEGKHPFQLEKRDKKGDHSHKTYDEFVTYDAREEKPGEVVKPEDRVKPSDEGQRLWLGRKMVKNYGCYSCHLLKKDGPMEWQNEEGIGVELTGAQPFGSKHHDRLDFGLTAEDGVNHHGVKFKHGFDGSEVPENVLETRHDWLRAKLNNPRVFDGGKMGSKPWDELLRMPWFKFSEQEIELLQTFVLSFTDHEPMGLVSGLKHRMTPDQIAKNRGERVVRDNNCRACHRLSLDRFEVRWEREEGEGDKRKKKESWEWLEGRNLGQLPPEAAEKALKDAGLLAKAEKFDEKSMGAWIVDWASDHRTLELKKVVNPDAKTVAKVGPRWWYLDKEPREIRHQVDMDGGEILPHLDAFKKALNKAYVSEKEKLDERNDDLDDLIKNAADNPAKQKELKDEQAAIRTRLAAEFPTDDLVKSDQMEGRYPPLLRTQGVKTQADWLFGFLKKPYPIRPNIFPAAPGAKSLGDVNIRMPSFELTDEETNAVVRWFAVRDHLAGTDFFPNTAIPEREESLLEKRKDLHQSVMTRILLNTDQGCAKCHYINGRPPTGDLYAYAPDLANVGQRLRPRWLYSWLNDPAAIYPRTTMTNFWSDLKNPNRMDEIHGAVELLMNPKKLSVPNK